MTLQQLASIKQWHLSHPLGHRSHRQARAAAQAGPNCPIREAMKFEQLVRGQQRKHGVAHTAGVASINEAALLVGVDG